MTQFAPVVGLRPFLDGAVNNPTLACFIWAGILTQQLEQFPGKRNIVVVVATMRVASCGTTGQLILLEHHSGRGKSKSEVNPEVWTGKPDWQQDQNLEPVHSLIRPATDSNSDRWQTQSPLPDPQLWKWTFYFHLHALQLAWSWSTSG